MSYIQGVANPPTKAVFRKCCRSTCGAQIKSGLKNVLTNNKLEVGLVLIIMSWLVVGTTLFAVAASAAIPAEYHAAYQIWMIFGGIVFCMPSTLILTFMMISAFFYFRRIYHMAMDQAQLELNPNMYESWRLDNQLEGEEFVARVI